jgi:VanZ family protein
MWQFIKTHTYRIGDKGFFSYVISPHPDFIAHKLGHIFAFGALGVSFAYAVGGRSMHLAVLLTSLFAASDEFHQYYVAGRSSRFGDIVLDTLSAMLFIFIVRKIEQRTHISEQSGKG